MIDRAMVLAAGLGKRMRPLTDTLPKPLVPVAGKALIDHVLDKLADAGVTQAVVNVHHRADQIEAHVKGRARPRIVISDERGELLDTGGGIVKALPHLGSAPFFHMNSDTVWIEGVTPNLSRLAAQFDAARMDILLLLASTATSIGYDGRGDFTMAPDGRLSRRAERQVAPSCMRAPRSSIPRSSPMRRRARSRSTACSTAPRTPAGSMACASTAPGCMSARPRRSRQPRPRFWRAWPSSPAVISAKAMIQ